jgi:hypothetical protein
MALMRLNFLGRMEKREEPWKKFTTRVPAFRSWGKEHKKGQAEPGHIGG